ncbi:MAG: sigma-70 family RNA polymerase sigma factor [Acidobacteriia bacterium]|nr:sigma-70 family RNA polymerase sigma factor [Terriglobia bacterium]
MELRATVFETLKSTTPGSAADDQELIRRCLNGEELAWECLVERYKRLIYSIPIKNGYQSSDAADIFQSVCLDLLESLGSLRDSTKLKTWLITVTVRKCIDLREKMSREAVTLSEGEADRVVDGRLDISRISLEVEQEQVIREAMKKLPLRCATLIQHLFFDEPRLSYSEIAKRFGVSSNSIGPARDRCLEKLKDILGGAGLTLGEAGGLKKSSHEDLS